MGKYHHGDLRAALIRASMELIAESGPAAFSVAAVARRLGVSTAAPYRHFTDRDQLLAEVSATAAREVTAAMTEAADQAGADPLDRFAAAIAAYFGFIARTGCGVQIIYAAGLTAPGGDGRTEATRELMAVTMDLAGATGRRTRADDLRLLEAGLALAHGYAALYADGFFRRTPESLSDLAARCAAAARLAASAGDVSGS